MSSILRAWKRPLVSLMINSWNGFQLYFAFLGEKKKENTKSCRRRNLEGKHDMCRMPAVMQRNKKDLLKHQTTSECLDQLREHCPERPSPKRIRIHCTRIQRHKTHNDKNNNKQQIIGKIMPVSGSWRHRWGRHRSKSRHRPNHRRASFQGLWARPARG